MSEMKMAQKESVEQLEEGVEAFETKRASSKQLIQVLNSLDAVVYIADYHTYELLFINDFGRKLLVDSDLFIGEKCWKVLQNEMEGPCPFCTNRFLLNPDGSPGDVYRWEFQNTATGRWYDCRDQALQWSDGRLIRLEIAMDITKRKKAEIELREAKEKYKALSRMLRLMCDNVQDMIWAKDLEKRYIFANKAICKNLLNASDPMEPIGKNDMFFAMRERQRHPDNPDWHTFGELCQDSDTVTIDRGEAGQFDEFGNVKGAFLFLDVRKTPFFDEEGNIIGTVGSARDVTEEKKKEKEREKLVATLQAALAEVKTLTGMLPICAQCKKIRDDQGYWNQVETYIRQRTDVQFTHGICPECAKSLYPDYDISDH